MRLTLIYDVVTVFGDPLRGGAGICCREFCTLYGCGCGWARVEDGHFNDSIQDGGEVRYAVWTVVN